MLRIAQINDTHEGITKPKTIRHLLLKLKEEKFDLLLHCGDYCGGIMGYKTVRSTVKLIREIFPDKPYVTVIGNHDYWCMNKGGQQYTSPASFFENYAKILQIFSQYKVWFLDQQGPYRQNDVVLVGHSGWYMNRQIMSESNDFLYLPIGINGDTQSYMLKRAMSGLYRNLDELTDEEKKKKTLVFVSHMPVIKTPTCDASFDIFGWSASLGEMLQRDYGIKYFFNGHAHQEHKGPLRWESGSDYFKPKYQIVEIR